MMTQICTKLRQSYRRIVPRRPRIALIRLDGVIGAARSSGRGLSDAALGPALERALAPGRVDAVALLINSPGGSPVQSALIAARIRRLAEAAKVPVHAFVEDVAASGGYWLACAADDIWADPASIVGSIGVISAGFGLEGLIAQHGIERRVHTAGGEKSFLDPFRPERPEDIARLETLLDAIHAEFIDWVTARRGARLAAREDLFTGAFWTGRQALETGLVDGLAHAVPKLKALYGDTARLVPVKLGRRGVLARLGIGSRVSGAEAAEPLSQGMSAGIGAGIGTGLATATAQLAEERALWARFGL